MNGRRITTGLCLLCALMISAIVAQGATAAGTTGFTCEKVAEGTGKIFDTHCKSVGSGSYEHVAITPNTTTQLALANVTTGEERSVAKLKAAVAGFGVVIEAKKVSGVEGTMENKEEKVGEVTEMWAEAEIKKLIFEEVTANLGCTTTGLPGGAGKIETVPLKITTKGQSDALKLEPKEGTKLAEFELSGAGCPEAVKGKYPVHGSVKGVPSGATTVFTHTEITAAKTLRLKNATEGPLTGFEGTFTISGKDASNPCTGEWPIAATTVP